MVAQLEVAKKQEAALKAKLVMQMQKSVEVVNSPTSTRESVRSTADQVLMPPSTCVQNCTALISVPVGLIHACRVAMQNMCME